MVNYNDLAIAVSITATFSHFISYAILHEHYSTLIILNVLYIFTTVLLKKTDFSTNLHISQGYLDKSLDECLSEFDCSVIQTFLFGIAFSILVILFFIRKTKKIDRGLTKKWSLGLKFIYFFALTVARWLYISLVVQSLVQIQRGDIGLSIAKLLLWTIFLVFCVLGNRQMEDDRSYSPITYDTHNKKGKKIWKIKIWMIDIVQFIHEAIKGIVMCLAFWNSWSKLPTAITLIVVSILLVLVKLKEEHVPPLGLTYEQLELYTKYRVYIEQLMLVATGGILVFCLITLALHDDLQFDHTIAGLLSGVVFLEALTVLVKFVYVMYRKCRKGGSHYLPME